MGSRVGCVLMVVRVRKENMVNAVNIFIMGPPWWFFGMVLGVGQGFMNL